MPSSVATSAAYAPAPLRLSTAQISSQDFFTSLNATLASKTGQSIPPQHQIQEHDYSVPAPPPPSPVGPRPQQWSHRQAHR